MPSRGVSHYVLKGSLTSFEGSLVLRPRREYGSALHVGMVNAYKRHGGDCVSQSHE